MTFKNPISSFELRHSSYVVPALSVLALAIGCSAESGTPGGSSGSTGTGAGTGGAAAGVGGAAAGVGGAAAGVGGAAAGVGGATGVGGTAGAGGATGVGGTAGAGGAAGGAGGSAGGSSYVCAHTAVPENGTITDFDPWASGMWGETDGLTGGQILYQDAAGTALVPTVTAGVMNLAATVTNYSGWGVWFGPCSDATAFTGISITLSGTVGGATVEFQAQTSLNYPVDAASMKGECAGTWGTGCASNFKEITIPATSMEVQIPFTDLIGGEPVATLNKNELLGLQMQFNCASGMTCAVDVDIDDIHFY